MIRNPLEARPGPTKSERISVDAYAPADIARRAVQSGVAKARTNTVTLMVLAVLAGVRFAGRAIDSRLRSAWVVQYRISWR